MRHKHGPALLALQNAGPAQENVGEANRLRADRLDISSPG
jgi:hypothetical protein